MPSKSMIKGELVETWLGLVQDGYELQPVRTELAGYVAFSW